MIKDSVKIHDKFSIELKTIYDIIPEQKNTEYHCVTYLFVPNGLNINDQTHTKAKFYNDVKVYIKYSASKYSLDDFLILKDSPLNKLKAYSVKFKNNDEFSEKENKRLRSKIKIFGVILKNTLVREYNAIKKSETELYLYLEELEHVTKQYREVLDYINNSKLEKNTIKEANLVDEYVSNITHYNLVRIRTHFKKEGAPKAVVQKIEDSVKAEIKYRKLKGYDAVKEDDYFNEKVLNRRSQLKSFVESVLFLNREVRKEGVIYEQTLLAVAAGLAMVFSTSLAFYYQLKYGNFTLPFFITLIIGYMLKDRIKGLIGLLFISKADSLFYDYKINIKNSEDTKIGEIKENFSFIPVNKLEKKVKKNRALHSQFFADYELQREQIIQYKKKISINAKYFGVEISDNRVKSLTDITRINFYRFRTHMDNPRKKYTILRKGKVVVGKGDKSYQINLIQKYFSEEEDEIGFKSYRITMNRNGIKRIEVI